MSWQWILWDHPELVAKRGGGRANWSIEKWITWLHLVWKTSLVSNTLHLALLAEFLIWLRMSSKCAHNLALQRNGNGVTNRAHPNFSFSKQIWRDCDDRAFSFAVHRPCEMCLDPADLCWGDELQVAIDTTWGCPIVGGYFTHRIHVCYIW